MTIAGSLTINFSTRSDVNDVHHELMTNASPTTIDVAGGTLTCTIRFTKGAFSAGTPVTISPHHEGAGLSHVSCDILRGAIEKQAADTLQDIRDWARDQDRWVGGGSLGTKVSIETVPGNFSHDIEVTATRGEEPASRDGTFETDVVFTFQDECLRH